MTPANQQRIIGHELAISDRKYGNWAEILGTDFNEEYVDGKSQRQRGNQVV